MSEEYHEMRTIEVNDDYETMVLDVQFTSNNKLQLVVDFAGEKRAILVPTIIMKMASHSETERDDTNGPSLYRYYKEPTEVEEAVKLINILFDEESDIKFNDLENKQIKLNLFDESDFCTIEDSNIKCSIKPYNESNDNIENKSETKIQEAKAKLKEAERRFTLLREYDRKGKPWKKQVEIKNPNKSKDGFKLTIETDADEDLEWEFEAPDSVDIEEDTTARLIEHVGGGELKFIDGEYVRIVHKSDVHNQLETLESDQTNEWYLVTPQDWKDHKKAGIKHLVNTLSIPIGLGSFALGLIGMVVAYLIGPSYTIAGPFIVGIITIISTILFMGGVLIMFVGGATLNEERKLNKI